MADRRSRRSKEDRELFQIFSKWRRPDFSFRRVELNQGLGGLGRESLVLRGAWVFRRVDNVRL